MITLINTQDYSELYGALALALYRPCEDLLSPSYLQTLKDLSSRLDLAIAEPLKELKDLYASQTMNLTNLEVEYSRLFIGPFSVPVPPYESCFREKGRVMGDTTVAVEKFYRRSGFAVDDIFKEPPDHIALEIHFISELCALEKTFAEQKKLSFRDLARQQQQEFLEKHLLAWAESYKEAVVKVARLPFYPAVSNIMVETTKTHFQSL